MKKLAFGCLIFVALLGIATALGGYLFVWKPLQAVAADWGECVENFRDIREMEQGLENHDPFVPPSDGLLTHDAVERFVHVQRAISVARADHETLRERVDEMRERRDLSHQEVIAGFVELSEALRAAKAEQVAALNARGFSLDEYRWVRGAFFAAIGINLVPLEVLDLPEIEFSLDGLSRLREFGGLNRLREIGGSLSSPASFIPDKNRELVQPYEDEAQSWISHAKLGL